MGQGLYKTLGPIKNASKKIQKKNIAKKQTNVITKKTVKKISKKKH